MTYDAKCYELAVQFVEDARPTSTPTARQALAILIAQRIQDVIEDELEDEAGIVTPRRRELSGESWDSHRIILSWSDIEDKRGSPPDGYNVVLHEFAHYLEAEGLGLAPGPSGARRATSTWLHELREEYARFATSVDRGEEVFLDPYGAEDEAEFFAVATEDFVERPGLFSEGCPEVYGLLREYYGIDPARWSRTD